jgi:predicted ATPase
VRQSLSFDGDDDRALVVDICRRLDGMPLAIELAARRVRHLTLDALCEHLSRQLDVLSGGPRDLPERQQTMRATIAWSHDLLSQPQQRVFRRLSVFAGGATLDAAARVCEVESAAALLPEISALVDQSLLALVPSPDAQPRYRMLEVIREFAAEQATAHDDPAALRRRHAEHFLAMAEEAQPHLVGREQQGWYGRLDADHQNLRVALRWALSQGETDIALRLVAALWMFWRQHGDFVEGSTWVTEALALPGGSADARLGALWGAAWLAYQRGDYARMRTIAAEHLDLARSAGDRTALRNALTEQGIALMTDGQPGAALESLGQALDIARDAGSPWIQAMSLFNFADCTALAGDLVEASRMLEAALAEFRAIGDHRFAARMLGRLALVALLRDDVVRARELAAECLQMLRDTGEKWGLAEGLEIMAGVAHGEPLLAAQLAGAAQALREATGTEPMAFDRRRIESYLARAEAALGSARWDAAVQEGSRMSPEEAIACAIE